MRLRTLGLIALLAARTLSAQSVFWVADVKPTLILGDAQSDVSVLFGAGLVGATRLPDGKILVADRGDYSLKLFAGDGKFIKNLGRKGQGPGEFQYIAQLHRCGDQIVAKDLGNGMLVFDLDLNFKRAFRYGSTTVSHDPYRSACNKAGTWVHYGWEPPGSMKPKMFRANVDAWMTGMDSALKISLPTIPGSERWGTTSDGRMTGSRPMPLGKQSVLAINEDRIFIGTADIYEIAIYDLTGKRVGTVKKANVDLVTTKEDIALELEREQAGQSEKAQKQIAEEFAAFEFPKTIPAYTKMLVDAEGQLWVQDYPRGKSTMSHWTVFSSTGVQKAEVLLPIHLDVYEIGRDYVLGKYIDPDEQIPQIRLYRLGKRQ